MKFCCLGAPVLTGTNILNVPLAATVAGKVKGKVTINWASKVLENSSVPPNETLASTVKTWVSASTLKTVLNSLLPSEKSLIKTRSTLPVVKLVVISLILYFLSLTIIASSSVNLVNISKGSKHFKDTFLVLGLNKFDKYSW